MSRSKNRKFKWKRCLAVSVAVITLATGLNYPGMENILAEEKSGYEIEVTYSEDSNNVTLTGNADNVPADTILSAVVGEDGIEYEPHEFETIVDENGTYTYMLDYTVTVPETGKTVDKEETVEVTVDQIKRIAEETVQNEVLADETEKAVTDLQQEKITETTEEIPAQPSYRSAVSVLPSGNSVTTRSAGGYDYDSTKTWSISDFTTRWTSSTYSHMDFNSDPAAGSVTLLSGIPSITNTSANGARIRFGRKEGNGWDGSHWIQQGAAFSDISFDFGRDFALVGAMQVGRAFGADTASYDAQDITIDGGLTISFVPQSKMSTAKSNAGLARGSAYRLGAYNTLPDSVICEYDLTSDTYYSIIGASDPRNFEILDDAFRLVGDYTNYTSSNGRFPGTVYNVQGQNVYEVARGKGHYENITHIGISTTGSDAKADQNSERVSIGRRNTGLIEYRIRYEASTKTITFTITTSDGDSRTISSSVSTLYNRLSANDRQNMKLCFTFGAAYLDIANFLEWNGSGYWSTGNTPGAGQIDIYAKELYVNPDLKQSDPEIRWLSSDTAQAGSSENNNAYYNDTTYADKVKWPVAGDRIYAQFNFVPRTSVMAQESSVNQGNLTLNLSELNIYKNNGTLFSGISPPEGGTIYYRNGDTGSWKAATSSTQIAVTGAEKIGVRIPITLPDMPAGSTEEGYYITGTLSANYTVGQSKINYRLPLMVKNDEKIPVSRGPVLMDFNGNSYYSSPRVVKSTDGISDNILNNIDNQGDRDGDGHKNSIHYGFGFHQLSTNEYLSVKLQEGETYPGAKFSYQSASVSDLGNVSRSSSYTYDSTEGSINLDFDKDIKYILDYTLADNVYTRQSTKPAQNSARGITAGKRVIWVSDNVEVQNGYEFYAMQNVTMSLKELEGFEASPDKAAYYRKIAEAAGVKVFKTSAYDFNDLINGNYNDARLSGNNNHDPVIEAIKNPGKSQNVQLKFTESGNSVVRTISLTVMRDVKKVTLENGTTDNDAVNSEYTKVLVKTGTNHTFNVTATFKYDDTGENFKKIKGENKLFAALYQQDNSSNGDVDGTGDFSFLKGSENVTSPLSSTNLVAGPVISELDERNKTFTVTFTVTDNDNLTTDKGYSTYNHKDYQIVAWTSANGANSFTNAGAAPGSLGDTQDDGRIPQVRSKIYVQKPIKVTANYEIRTEKFYGNTGSFTTNFDYDNRNEFTVKSSINYAIYRVQGGDNALGICEAGTISLENGTVTRKTGNQHYQNVDNVTAQIDDVQGKIQLKITLNSYEGRTRSTYKVYVWNESNGSVNVLSGDSISPQYKQGDTVLTGYPLSSTKILKIPKVYTGSTTSISQTETNKMFYEGDPFTVSATFTLEGGKTNNGTGDIKETINNLLADMENTGELKIALYKVNPSIKGAKGYQMFALARSNADENSLEIVFKKSTIGAVNIAPRGNTGFTVTFTKTNGEYQWDDGASYYIYAWTGANAGASELPGKFGDGVDNTIVSDADIQTVNTLIPSVKTSMLGILTEEHFEQIIHYPKEIAMMDNVKPGNRHIFSANQKITMTPLRVQEGGATVDAEIPDPDSGVDVVIREIRDKQNAQSSIQISRTVGSVNESINLTCFLGTIESGTASMISNSGKVGTLYFENTRNELPLYFRSSGATPPAVADGAAFTGQIHFIFSKSQSGN